MKPINTALFAYGMSGSVFHAPFIDTHSGFNLYGVLERSKKTASLRYPDIRSFATAEELLDDDDIELVVINTPNLTHFDLAKRSLEAGKHVIVEKPFTISAEEAGILMEMAGKKGLHLAVYHNRRWDSDFLTVKRILDQKLLGEVVEGEIHFDRYKEIVSAKQHKEIPGPGTGILYDLGSHLIDQSLVLFGRPESVFADLRIIRPVSSVDDYMELILYYPSLRVRIKGSYLVREAIPAYSFFGSKGSFLKHRGDIQEERLLAGELPGTLGWGVEPRNLQGILHTEVSGVVKREEVETEKGNYMEYYNRVYKAIRENEPLPVPASDGKNIIQIIEAAIRSNKERKVIDLVF